MIWSQLLHLGFNFWDNRPESASLIELPYRLRSDSLRCDDDTWNAAVETLRAGGANQVLVDIGEGIRFDSHPEIAATNAWSKDRLATELQRLRSLGLTPIPKLNFSASHDEWMGEYGRMLSTTHYYNFCRDIIAEAVEMFDSPQYFHIGMDEETAYDQREYTHVSVRQYELWFQDLDFYAREVARHGARPWMWSDMMWNNETNYVNSVSRDILQSNWYYGLDFNGTAEPLPGERTFQKPADTTFFEKLEKAGYDQVPAGSNYANSQNMEMLVEFCKDRISSDHLLGFLQTTWYPTIDTERERIVGAAAQLGAAREKYNKLIST